MVFVRYPRNLDHGDFLDHLERITGFVKRREPWAMLNDSRGSGHPNAKQRQAIATMYEENETNVRAFWRGTAIIFDSQVIVGVLTALTWLKPPPHPFRAFSSYDDGLSWVTQLLPVGSVRASSKAAGF